VHIKYKLSTLGQCFQTAATETIPVLHLWVVNMNCVMTGRLFKSPANFY